MNELYKKYCHALKGIQSPSLFLDLDAFESNMNWIIKNSGKKTIRIATKSVRCVAVLRKIFAYSPIFQGLMTYTLKEALWLRDQGFKDILMGYPTTDEESLKILAQDPSGITLMVDLPEHIELLNSLKAPKKISICLDLDLSLDLPGVRFGVFRSNLTDDKGLAKLLQVVEASTHIKLIGLMGYEAQIAGLGDATSPLIRFLKKQSIKHLRERRERVYQAIIKNGHHLSFVNGGGTGSLTSTREEAHVSEITIGSGFYAPALFDHYLDFKLTPALAFTLPVVRRPSPGIITCLGGGYIASGSIEKSKLPVAYLPEGLELLKHEGAGEVQTPFKVANKLDLSVGDLIIMRHAKAAEICERFNEIQFIKNGQLADSAPTYRGEGKCFL